MKRTAFDKWWQKRAEDFQLPWYQRYHFLAAYNAGRLSGYRAARKPKVRKET